jgi:hypothetical protein
LRGTAAAKLASLGDFRGPDIGAAGTRIFEPDGVVFCAAVFCGALTGKHVLPEITSCRREPGPIAPLNLFCIPQPPCVSQVIRRTGGPGLSNTPRSLPKAEPERPPMIAIARVVSRASGAPVDVEMLRTLFLFCGTGLTLSLLAASLGLDLSPGFF